MGKSFDPYDDGRSAVSRLAAVIFFGVLTLAGTVVSTYFVLLGIQDVPRGSRGYPTRELSILRVVTGVDIAIAVIAALAILTFASRKALLFNKLTFWVGAVVVLLAIVLIGVSISAVVLLYKVALLEPFHIIATGAAAAAGVLGITFGGVIMTAKRNKRDSFASFDATAPRPGANDGNTALRSAGNKMDEHLSTPKNQWSHFESGSSDNLMGSPQSPGIKGRDSYNSLSSPQTHYNQGYGSRPSTGSSEFVPNQGHGTYSQDPLHSARSGQATYAQQQQQPHKYGNVAPNAPKQRSNLGATDPLTAHATGSTPSINVTSPDTWHDAQPRGPASILKTAPEAYGAQSRRKSYEASHAKRSYETARTQQAPGGYRRQSQEGTQRAVAPAAGDLSMANYGGPASASTDTHLSTYESHGIGMRSSQPYGGVLADYGVRESTYVPHPPSSQGHAPHQSPSPSNQAHAPSHEQYHYNSPPQAQGEWSGNAAADAQRSEYHDARLAQPEQAEEAYGHAYSGYDDGPQAYGHPEHGEYPQHQQQQAHHQAYAYN